MRENGLLAGFPLIDFKATLVDGAYHDVDSSVLGLRNRGPAPRLREAKSSLKVKLLEPIMKGRRW